MRGTLALVLQVMKIYMWKTKLLTMCRPRRDSDFVNNILMTLASDVKGFILFNTTLIYIIFSRQFDIAFEGACSLRDMEMSVKPLSYEEIKNNMSDLKKKLTRDTSNFRGHERF
ncbi:hypothetical protein Glove_465g48 [Diversispora epigaea]|uniref:Uncharacterized protein n=1 Tax=Diversispora epigaea TaxID=1348612 RepID=A0A397GP76_9GLOM|nr:hypothetical protein Glove_465g48 [Diversispora epigaea]